MVPASVCATTPVDAPALKWVTPTRVSAATSAASDLKAKFRMEHFPQIRYDRIDTIVSQDVGMRHDRAGLRPELFSRIRDLK